MIRSVFIFIFFWMYLLGTIPWLLAVILLGKMGKAALRQRVVLAVTRHWARSLIAVTGSTVRVTGLEHVPQDTAVVVIANHQSNFDIPLVLSVICRPVGFIAKAELAKLPLFSTWMTQMGCLFMDRSNKRQSLTIILEAVKRLRTGMSYIIFPEGTRSQDGTLSEFKAGSFKLPTKAGVPILPVVINGSMHIMKKKSFIINPVNMELTIFPAIATVGKDPAELAEQAQSIISGGLVHGQA